MNNAQSARGTYRTPARVLQWNQTWSSYPKKCEFCKKTSRSILDLKDHYKSEHGKFYGFKCFDCNVLIPWFAKFVEHVREHRPELTDYCPICDIRITEPNHVNYQTETCFGKPSFILPTSAYKGKKKMSAINKQQSEIYRQKLRSAKKYEHKNLTRQERDFCHPLQLTAGDVSTTAFADNCDYTTKLVIDRPSIEKLLSPKIETPEEVAIAHDSIEKLLSPKIETPEEVAIAHDSIEKPPSPKIETPEEVAIAHNQDFEVNILHGYADIFLANGHRLEEFVDVEKIDDENDTDYKYDF